MPSSIEAARSDSAIDLAPFEEGLAIGRSDRVLTQTHLRRMNRALAVVKSVSLSRLLERRQIETENEHLLDLRLSLMTPLVGFVFPAESKDRMKTVRLHTSGLPLAEVLLNPLAWWTMTAKAKALAGIALALQFARCFGLLYGEVKVGNLVFDADWGIQIADFSAIRLETGEVEPFSREK